jgi:hypothetical protein
MTGPKIAKRTEPNGSVEKTKRKRVDDTAGRRLHTYRDPGKPCPDPDFRPGISVKDPEECWAKAFVKMKRDYAGPMSRDDLAMLRAGLQKSAKAKAEAEDVILAAAAKLLVPAEAAALAIAAHPEWSDRKLAEAVGVDPKTVGKARKSTGEFSPVEKTIGLDGKARKRRAADLVLEALPS